MMYIRHVSLVTLPPTNTFHDVIVPLMLLTNVSHFDSVDSVFDNYSYNLNIYTQVFSPMVHCRRHTVFIITNKNVWRNHFIYVLMFTIQHWNWFKHTQRHTSWRPINAYSHRYFTPRLTASSLFMSHIKCAAKLDYCLRHSFVHVFSSDYFYFILFFSFSLIRHSSSVVVCVSLFL